MINCVKSDTFSVPNQPILHAHHPPDVPIGTHVLPLTISSEKEVADGGSGLVHARKWIGQNAHMVVQGDFHVENVKVIDGAQRVHHLERCRWSEVLTSFLCSNLESLIYKRVMDETVCIWKRCWI